MEPQGTDEKQYNRLIHEKSPYLLQHATNPVDWYAWGDAAFERARMEDKPVFLSIGYSTCHWCHVMEKESFEDEEVARAMNEVFVSIKVDREERPDIDGIYMTACQMLTGSGGWPLTIFMTPEKKPFFAGTYIPKHGRFGRVGMMELIPQVGFLWKTRREDLFRSADQIVEKLRETTTAQAGGELSEKTLHETYDGLDKRFDPVHGGFGGAPKFPTPHNLSFLLRYARRTGNAHALEMVEKTLQAMRRGGIWDHVGFGFHRYSTDTGWLVPHFEKMLYDQAMLALAYTEAYQMTGKAEYRETADQIFTYVLRDMTGPEGEFFSAEDADSEGEEGKFYLWAEDEIGRVLGKEPAYLISRVYSTTLAGNFSEEATHERTGRNILHLAKPLDAIAPKLGVEPEVLSARVEAARARLFEERERRVRPLRDDKVLADWNGLMIAAMAKASQVFEDARLAEAAAAAMRFVLTRMRGEGGRLLHRFRAGDASIQGTVDDYAFVTWGLLELYEATFDASYLGEADALTADLLAHFGDGVAGGFFFAPDDGEPLLIRQKDIYDGAVPSGNSVAMLNLLRLSRITGDAGLEERAADIARAFAGAVNQFPSAYTQLMVAADFSVGPVHEVVVCGDPQSLETRKMLAVLRGRFMPNKVVIFKPDDVEEPEVVRLAPFVAAYHAIDDRATAYVCTNHACRLPTTDPEEMLKTLGEG
jgi:uncharacterized protein